MISAAEPRELGHLDHLTWESLPEEDLPEKDLPEADRVVLGGGGAASTGVVPVLSSAASGCSASRWSRCITTLPSNRMTAPPSEICMRSEESVPLVSFTSTC